MQPVLLTLTLLTAQALATVAYRIFGFDTVGGNFYMQVIFWKMSFIL